MLLVYWLLLLLSAQVWWQARLYSTHLNNKPKHVEIALQYANILEYGNNRSIVADSSNIFTKQRLGTSYCQSFVSWILEKAYPSKYKPTALATAFRGKRQISAISVIRGKEKVKAGYIITWQKGKTIFGHSGIAIEDWEGPEGMTIQANTSKRIENRNGDGIFIKKASIKPYSYFRIIRFWEV